MGQNARWSGLKWLNLKCVLFRYVKYGGGGGMSAGHKIGSIMFVYLGIRNRWLINKSSPLEIYPLWGGEGGGTPPLEVGFGSKNTTKKRILRNT